MKGRAFLLIAALLVGSASSAIAQPPPAEAPPPSPDAPEPPSPEPPEPGALPDEVKVCLSAFTDAQRLRRESKLIAARAATITCSQPACPDSVVPLCTTWLHEVEAAIPTIILLAKDGHDQDLVHVRVAIDGVVAAELLDGRPVELDPGAHVVMFQPPEGPAVSVEIVAVQAEKNRTVMARFVAPPPPQPPLLPPPFHPKPRDRGRISPWTWVGFGVSGAALTAGIITGALALGVAADLADQCIGTVCPEREQDNFDKGAALANASTAMFVIAGAGAAFGAAALLWLGDAPRAGAVRPLLLPGYVGLVTAF